MTSTVADALSRATATLEAHGVDTARLDAELLLAAALGRTRSDLYRQPSDLVPAAAADRFEALIRRRAGHEPVAYLLGRKGFRWIELQVDPRVLIPRPETELLVEVGLELAPGARVADVGTGSGAVALALKHERPDLEVTGIDTSADALEVARQNASRLGLEVRFIRGDLLVGGPYDAALANLPYVADADELAPEIADFEPPGALFGGPDGLDLVRRMVPMLPAVPLVALEVGAGQAEEVSRLLREAGYASVARRRDLAGHDRVVVGRR